ncbi:MAG: TIGR02757 family protein [Myxococcota bacterium]|nr:TIGR02757 family protein [Myxococcota bacterium]
MRIHTALEQLEAARSDASRLSRDPLGRVHAYEDPLDAEVAGLCAAQIAYGRVDLFLPILDVLFERMEESGGPRSFVMEGLDGCQPSFWSRLSYRWTKGDDWRVFLLALRSFLSREGSLKDAFETRWEASASIEAIVGDVVDSLRREALRVTEGDALSRGTRYFLVSPSGGSACKRWMLYLRWMARPDDGVDLGLFGIPASDLIMPVDTHVLRIGQFLGLTKRKDASWKTAVDITKALKSMDPGDPTRFDFALAHVGISSGCTGKRGQPVCVDCAIRDICRAPKR